MNALTPRNERDDMFPEVFRRFFGPAASRWLDDGVGEIRVDITESARDYQVRAIVPGAKKEDIRVSVDGNFVSISAEVRQEKEQKSGDRVLVKETWLGNSSRGFSVAHEIDAKAVVAKLEDGVLKLTLPKLEGSGARTINVQ